MNGELHLERVAIASRFLQYQICCCVFACLFVCNCGGGAYAFNASANITWQERTLYAENVYNVANVSAQAWTNLAECLGNTSTPAVYCRSGNLLLADISDTLVASGWVWHATGRRISDAVLSSISSSCTLFVRDIRVRIRRFWKEVLFPIPVQFPPPLDHVLALADTGGNELLQPRVLARLYPSNLTAPTGVEVWPYNTPTWIPFRLLASQQQQTMPSYTTLRNASFAIMEQMYGMHASFTTYYYVDAMETNVTLSQRVSFGGVMHNTENTVAKTLPAVFSFMLLGEGFLALENATAIRFESSAQDYEQTTCATSPVGATSVFLVNTADISVRNATHVFCVQQPRALSMALQAFAAVQERPACVWTRTFRVSVRFLPGSADDGMVLENPWLSAGVASSVNISYTFSSTESVVTPTPTLTPFTLTHCTPSVVRLRTPSPAPDPISFFLKTDALEIYTSPSPSPLSSLTITFSATAAEAENATVLAGNATSVHVRTSSSVFLERVGYVLIVVRRANVAVSETFLLYVAQECIEEGVWFSGAACLPCPRGGFCPGGARVWPRRGYWSAHELTAPQRCVYENACPGAIGELGAYPSIIEESGAHETSQCAAQEGYTGPMCRRCISGFFRDGTRCLSCGDSGGLMSYNLIVALLLLFGILAIAILFLPNRYLDVFVDCLMAVQQSVSMLQIVARHAGSDESNQVLSLISMVSFRIESIRPGCLYSDGFGYIEVFWGTIVVVLLAIILFALASLARGCCVGCSAAIARRLPRAYFILAMFVYLQLCTVTLRGVYCVPFSSLPGRESSGQPIGVGGGSSGERDLQRGLRLVDQPGIQCYFDKHMYIAPLLWLSLLLFVLGYPLGTLVATCKRHKRQQHAVGPFAYMRDADSDSITYTDVRPKRTFTDYLVRNLKPHMFWFRALLFCVAFCVAVTSVFVRDATLSLILLGCVYAAHCSCVATMRPFCATKANVVRVLIDVLLIAQIHALLFFLSDQPGMAIIYIDSAWFIFTCVGTGIALSRYVCNRRKSRRLHARYLRPVEQGEEEEEKHQQEEEHEVEVEAGVEAITDGNVGIEDGIPLLAIRVSTRGKDGNKRNRKRGLRKKKKKKKNTRKESDMQMAALVRRLNGYGGEIRGMRPRKADSTLW